MVDQYLHSYRTLQLWWLSFITSPSFFSFSSSLQKFFPCYFQYLLTIKLWGLGIFCYKRRIRSHVDYWKLIYIYYKPRRSKLTWNLMIPRPWKHIHAWLQSKRDRLSVENFVNKPFKLFMKQVFRSQIFISMFFLDFVRFSEKTEYEKWNCFLLSLSQPTKKMEWEIKKSMVPCFIHIIDYSLGWHNKDWQAWAWRNACILDC